MDIWISISGKAMHALDNVLREYSLRCLGKSIVEIEYWESVHYAAFLGELIEVIAQEDFLENSSKNQKNTEEIKKITERI